MRHKQVKKKSIYNGKRYWYHVSTTLKHKRVHLTPKSDGINRSGYEPDGERICVSPTVEQCLTAIPYHLDARCTIYRTEKKVRADKPRDVFDAKVTQEGWIQTPTTFVKVGKIRLADVEKGLGVEHVVEEAASSGHASSSGKVLKWWKRAKIKRFIKKV